MEKIKEMYGLKEFSGDLENKYDIWFNKLLNKTLNEITINDVYTMFTQHELEYVAIPKAIDFISNDPLAGEMWDGQLLEQLSDFSVSQLLPYKDELKKVLYLTENYLDKQLWDFEYEKDNFISIFDKFKRKVTSIEKQNKNA